MLTEDYHVVTTVFRYIVPPIRLILLYFPGTQGRHACPQLTWKYTTLVAHD